jgi:hypothetical protein
MTKTGQEQFDQAAALVNYVNHYEHDIYENSGNSYADFFLHGLASTLYNKENLERRIEQLTRDLAQMVHSKEIVEKNIAQFKEQFENVLTPADWDQLIKQKWAELKKGKNKTT